MYVRVGLRIENTFGVYLCEACIGHLGDLNDLMVLGALAGAEMAMRDVGIDLTLGSGVAAAQTHFRKTISNSRRRRYGTNV